ncbi:DAK2 domain-containing protein [Rothia sp. P4278]|uniref:DAK2 domain-containing protein n=1 Tax=Rothia sp. P4278 TaxID=3402658 RepID=UPI003ADC34E3
MRQVPANWWLSWLLGGRTQLVEHRALLNRINVFPVADADTGSNLSATLGRAADSAGMADDPTLALAARAALRGARGNSGTLLAVWLLGLARELGPVGELEAVTTGIPEENSALTPALLASAFKRAVRDARSALSQPAEGTMLTVMQAIGQVPPADDWLGYTSQLLQGAETAVRETAQASHARNGWVDSGALGFLLVLVALATELNGSAPTKTYADLLEESPAPSWPNALPPFSQRSKKSDSTVEVMCDIYLPVLEASQLRSALDAVGDSVSIAQVEAGNEALWAIHVHTPTAADALTVLEAAGEPLNVRISNLAPGDSEPALAGCSHD